MTSQSRFKSSKCIQFLITLVLITKADIMNHKFVNANPDIFSASAFLLSLKLLDKSLLQNHISQFMSKGNRRNLNNSNSTKKNTRLYQNPAPLLLFKYFR